MAIEKFALELLSTQTLTPTVKSFTFKRADNQPIVFIAGQFITLLLLTSTGELKRRSYSVANPPQNTATVELVISYVKGGVASEYLFNLKPGEIVEAAGPAGKLILQQESVKRYILVGTGTGVAPYHAMLPELSERCQKEGVSVHILQGVQYRRDVLYLDAFLRFATTCPNAKFTVHYSREAQDNAAAYEQFGYVQNYFTCLNLNPAQDIVYLCGNPNMIDDAFSLLQSLGLSSKQIRREKYISSN